MHEKRLCEHCVASQYCKKTLGCQGNEITTGLKSHCFSGLLCGFLADFIDFLNENHNILRTILYSPIHACEFKQKCIYNRGDWLYRIACCREPLQEWVERPRISEERTESELVP